MYNNHTTIQKKELKQHLKSMNKCTKNTYKLELQLE